MDHRETSATLNTQDTGRRQTKQKHNTGHKKVSNCLDKCSLHFVVVGEKISKCIYFKRSRKHYVIYP